MALPAADLPQVVVSKATAQLVSLLVIISDISF